MKRFALVAVVTALVSCGPTEVVSDPAENAPGGGGLDVAEPPKVTATIGNAIELRGQENDSKVRVTMVQIVDPAKPKDQFTRAGEGGRFVAVQVRLENIGEAVYSDSPDNSLKIIDAAGQQFSTTFGEVTAGPGFGGSATISPGDNRMGFLTVEMPNASKPTKVQFTLNSGFGPQTGEWSVP
jgi:hypothetical protein